VHAHDRSIRSTGGVVGWLVEQLVGPRRVGLPWQAIVANLVTDAHLAALAVEYGLELCSNDSDFARFPGLHWHNPLRGDRCHQPPRLRFIGGRDGGEHREVPHVDGGDTAPEGLGGGRYDQISGVDGGVALAPLAPKLSGRLGDISGQRHPIQQGEEPVRLVAPCERKPRTTSTRVTSQQAGRRDREPTQTAEGRPRK
jgi:hypothetical protein